MALARCCQRQTNVTVQEKKVSWSLPLDKGHFITGVIDGTVIEAVYGMGGAAIGAIGWLIHWAVADKMDKSKAKKYMTEEDKKG